MRRITLFRLRDRKALRTAQRSGLHIAITDAIYPGDTYTYDCDDAAEATEAMHEFHLHEFHLEVNSAAQARPYDFAVIVQS